MHKYINILETMDSGRNYSTHVPVPLWVNAAVGGPLVTAFIQDLWGSSTSIRCTICKRTFACGARCYSCRN